MNIAVEHRYFKDDLSFSDLLHTLDMARQIKCSTLFVECDAPRREHMHWLRDVVASCRDFYFIVRLPVYYLGANVVMDAQLNGYICHFKDEIRRRILAVNLSCGIITKQDYVLRLFGLLRRGMTFSLVVDDLRDFPGSYKDIVYDAAFAVLTNKGNKTEKVDTQSIVCVDTLWQLLKARFDKNIKVCVIKPELIKRRKFWVSLLSR